MDADLSAFRGDKDLPDVGVRQVTDDVPVLEVAAQRLMELQGDNVQEAVVVPAVGR